MAISNSGRSPDPVCDGQILREGRNSAGLIFYNHEGDECGGLAFGGRRVDDGHGAWASFMFDQFKQDQVVGISHQDAAGRRSAGLYVWDRPDAPLPAIDGAAALKFLDASGNVTARLPDEPSG